MLYSGAGEGLKVGLIRDRREKAVNNNANNRLTPFRGVQEYTFRLYLRRSLYVLCTWAPRGVRDLVT